MNALDLCLNITYSCFRKTFYCQIFGFAMGSPVSVIVANLVMDSIENRMISIENKIEDFVSPSRILIRYMNDILVALNKTYVASSTNLFNNIVDCLKFTVEHEVDNAFPFLDVLIIRNVNSGQSTIIQNSI